MSNISDRRQEILDGKRKWTTSVDAGGDFDVFFTQVVKPLRSLRDAGMFTQLEEIQSPSPVGYQVAMVEIRGAIDLDFPKINSN